VTLLMTRTKLFATGRLMRALYGVDNDPLAF
jgi:hypothetical protein